MRRKWSCTSSRRNSEEGEKSTQKVKEEMLADPESKSGKKL
jgi:hypothetical protein